MNTIGPIAALFASTLALAACTTSAPPAEPLITAVPPPDFQRDLPLEPPPPMVNGRVCQLGTSCLELDPRPFEACLVSTPHCADKAREPLLVTSPETPDEPAPLPIRK